MTNISFNLKVVEKIKENNNAIVSQLEKLWRRYSVITKDKKCFDVENIIIYDDNNFQYGIGKYFEGKVLNGEKVIYKGDVRDIILSDVKNRRVLNFERKENFIYKNTLYLYDGLDVTIKELKKEIKYSNEYEDVWEKNLVLEFKNGFTFRCSYGEDKQEKNANVLKVFLGGSIEHIPTKRGEEKKKIEEELKELNIKIDSYTLEKLLNNYNIIKK